MKKDAKKTVRFDEDLAEALERAGQELDREFSDCVRHILKSWLRDHGYLEDKGKKKKAYTAEI